MRSTILWISNFPPQVRRSVIILMDIVVVLLSVPLSLLLSNSYLSFNPFLPFSLLAWLAIGLASHCLFRVSGLYRMMWRFASTPDFFFILRNCALLSVLLYGCALTARSITPITGLNEREFIIFFFVTFAFISVPRLLYRYLREGPAWSRWDGRRTRAGQKRALFLGSLEEADIIISYTRAHAGNPIRVIGIVTGDTSAAIGNNIHGVPIVGDRARARQTLEEYLKDSDGVELVIFGQGAEKVFADFPELVRVARQSDVAVEQFSSLSNLRRGKLVLEKVEMETILRRSTVSADQTRLAAFMTGKRVLVTGGAGSIGRVLVKRALELNAEAVLVADISEFNIFRLQSGFIDEKDLPRVMLRILDIGDKEQLTAEVRQFQPDIIFHAAALKHVPLLEENWESAVKTNVFGTLNCAEVAVECHVPQFVLISSDKAADPTSVLGLTKFLAEQIANAMHFAGAGNGSRGSNLIGVRFGNVFGSDGSVATIFQSQIDAGGPITITDPTMTRYMMTIGEAVDLVIMAAAVSATADLESSHGIYMLDMGEPVSILAVAETMIRLAGKKPHQDVQIVVTGRRPGEKLHESIKAPGEQVIDVGVPSVFGLKTRVLPWGEVAAVLNALRKTAKKGNRAAAWKIMKDFCGPLADHAPTARNGHGQAAAAMESGEPEDLTDGAQPAAAPNGAATGTEEKAPERLLTILKPEGATKSGEPGAKPSGEAAPSSVIPIRGHPVERGEMNGDGRKAGQR